MAKVSKNRADKFELNLIDAKTWNMDLELHDEDVIDMGYMQGAELMGIDPQKILKSRYKKKSNDKYL